MASATSAPLRVTEALKLAGLINTRYFTKEACDRGSAVHAAAHYLDEGDLDESTVDPRVRPYLEQYERWAREQVGLEVLACEEEVVHPTYGYAGRLDRRVRLNGREGVLDLKTSASLAPSVGPQVAAYAATFQRPMERWALLLQPDRYRLIALTNREDFEVFKAALVVARFRRIHGLVTLEEVA